MTAWADLFMRTTLNRKRVGIFALAQFSASVAGKSNCRPGQSQQTSMPRRRLKRRVAQGPTRVEWGSDADHCGEDLRRIVGLRVSTAPSPVAAAKLYRALDGLMNLPASKAAWVRFRAPISVRTVWTWVLTVPVVIPRASAISWFDFPNANCARTSS